MHCVGVGCKTHGTVVAVNKAALLLVSKVMGFCLSNLFFDKNQQSPELFMSSDRSDHRNNVVLQKRRSKKITYVCVGLFLPHSTSKISKFLHFMMLRCHHLHIFPPTKSLSSFPFCWTHLTCWRFVRNQITRSTGDPGDWEAEHRFAVEISCEMAMIQQYRFVPRPFGVPSHNSLAPKKTQPKAVSCGWN